MASTVALYSSSPPSAVFSAPRKPFAADGEIDLSRRAPANSHGSRRVSGGLSCLFAGSAAKVAGHPGMAPGEARDSSAAGPPSAFPTALLEGGGMLGSRDGLEVKPSAAVNIPVASSLRARDKSPVSVLYGVGSSKSSSPAAGAGWEASHTASTGLPPLQRPHFPADRQLFSLPLDRGGAGAARGPELRSIGFRLGNDGDSEAGFHGGCGMRSDGGDVAAFAPSREWCEHLEGDIALDFAGGYGRARQDGPSLSSVPWGSPKRMPASGPSGVREPGQEGRRRWTQLTQETDLTDALSRRANLSLEARSPQLPDEQELLAEAQKLYPVFCDPLVKRAFNVAASAHQGQVRKDGQPYLSHCLETAILLVQCGLDKTVVAAGLLHDTLDDSMMSEQQLRTIFGDEVAELVVGVSKVSKFSQLARDNGTVGNAREAAFLRNMFLAMADFRVVLIKLADRLHNLRTLGALPGAKQQRVAHESLEIFAPLANRLGIWSWKAEMEDLCFQYLHPREHSDLAAKLEDGRGKALVLASLQRLDAALKAAGVRVHDLSGRPKNLYSVYRKMAMKGRRVDEIFDLRGLRLIVPDEESCYKAMEVVQSLWQSTGEEHFKDYISSPKNNGYQSLHTVVEGEGGHSLEVQIRTREMHQQAEFGVAAHWQYKEGDAQHSAGLQQKVAWIRWTLYWLLESQLHERKLRLHPADASLSPPCPFPTHNEGCPFGGGPGHEQAARPESDSDPFYVLVAENDGMSVQELPAGSTVADMLIQLHHGTGRDESSRQHSVRPLVNQEFVDDLGQRLRMGDLVELAMEPSELADVEPYPEQLLPLHAHREMPPAGSLRPAAAVDTMLVELERQRLKKAWLAGAR